MAWVPSESEKEGAVALAGELLRMSEEQQLGVLVVLVNLWCYHQRVKRGQANAA